MIEFLKYYLHYIYNNKYSTCGITSCCDLVSINTDLSVIHLIKQQFN